MLRVLSRIYNFITGGSVVSLAGTAAAIAVAALPVPAAAKPAAVLAVIALTLAASSFERVE